MGSNMNITLPLSAVGEKELKLIGSFRYGAGDYPLGISLVERGLVNLTPLRTHQYSFEDAVTAFETTANGKDKDGKVCLYSVRCEESANIWT
jgi:D-xylulose reductase